ncbi:MAG: MBL fold metallo-hydrolase [Oscillospiraceae bacterium]|nr:MBL fold metallo-hydrolase [Oscillospiraceae bacterium]
MAKKIATWIAVPAMILIFVLDIMTVALGNRYVAAVSVSPELFNEKNGGDRIHFLNTSNSDAILIESNGRFAMIDSGEGSENPRRDPGYYGFEETVLSYLKKAAGDENGRVHLDFILLTHYHYDHSGCLHAILTDDSITVGTVYMKPYDPSFGKSYEPHRWGLISIYEQLVRDVRARGLDPVGVLPNEPFPFGSFTLQFYNTVTPETRKNSGENLTCVGVKVTKGGQSAFLASDITATSGSEQAVRGQIGEVTLLKIAHHGYYGSSTAGFLRELKPKLAIVTNALGKIYPNVKWNLTMIARTPVFSTHNSDGIIASFTDDGMIVLTDHIH